MRRGFQFLFSRSIQLLRFVAMDFVSKDPITLNPVSVPIYCFRFTFLWMAIRNWTLRRYYFPVPRHPEERAGNGRCRRTTRGYNAFAGFRRHYRTRGRIEEFRVLRGKRIFTHLPVNFSCASRTRGRSTIRPVGNAFITNMISSQSLRSRSIRNWEVFLPNSIRRYYFDWKKGDDIEQESEFKRNCVISD